MKVENEHVNVSCNQAESRIKWERQGSKEISCKIQNSEKQGEMTTVIHMVLTAQ